MKTTPFVFKTGIGGFVGPSYEVERTDEGLLYTVYERGYTVHITETITPSTDDWRHFTHAMDSIGIWSWKPLYQKDGASDATTWFVDLRNGYQEITSKGLNLYPPLFTEYLRAVRTLLGGRHFA